MIVPSDSRKYPAKGQSCKVTQRTTTSSFFLDLDDVRRTLVCRPSRTSALRRVSISYKSIDKLKFVGPSEANFSSKSFAHPLDIKQGSFRFFLQNFKPRLRLG